MSDRFPRPCGHGTGWSSASCSHLYRLPDGCPRLKVRVQLASRRPYRHDLIKFDANGGCRGWKFGDGECPMDLKKRTFEDLIGNFADDAKKALDEILEREPTSAAPAGLPGVGVPVGNLAGAAGGAVGTATAAVGGLANTVSDLNATVSGLAGLPAQIATLSELIAKLLPLVETLTGALSTVGDIAGAAGKASPTGKS